MSAAKPCLLIIDDDVSTIRLICNILDGVGELYVATDGERALGIARERRPDLVLLDAEMPGMDGFAVCAALKSVAEISESPIIFVTAHSSIAYESRALDLGAVDFIAKPISPPILLARVRTHLALKLHADALQDQNQGLEARVRERTRDLMAANQELILARDGALAATRAKSEFLAAMSHELRTPFNAIIGFGEIVRMRETDEVSQRFLDIMLQSSKSLLAMIQGVLDYAKIDTCKVPTVSADFDVGATLNEAMSPFKAEIGRKGLAVSLDIAPGWSGWLKGDQPLVGQILSNLIDNAVKFTERGEIKISVRPADRDSDDGTIPIIFEVADSGIGIHPENLERMFNVFEREDTSLTTRFGGMGLGLATAKRIVERLGGEIGVTSVPGVGSCFRVQIPFARV